MQPIMSLKTQQMIANQPASIGMNNPAMQMIRKKFGTRMLGGPTQDMQAQASQMQQNNRNRMLPGYTTGNGSEPPPGSWTPPGFQEGVAASGAIPGSVIPPGMMPTNEPGMGPQAPQMQALQRARRGFPAYNNGSSYIAQPFGVR